MIGRLASSRFSAYQNCNCILEAEGNQGALYLGDYTVAMDMNFLKSKGINTVLTVAAGLPVSYHPSNGIFHKIYQALDIESYNIAKHFPDTFKQIDEGLQRGSVYVHCAAGVSRSASTVIAYLMKKYGWPYVKAHGFVRSKRPVICPNFGFTRQLRNFEKQCKAVATDETHNKIQQQTMQQNSPQNQQVQFQIKGKGLEEEEKTPNKQVPQPKKKMFSKSAQKYTSVNQLTKALEQMQIAQPNIVTYGPHNQIIKKSSKLPQIKA